MILGGCKYPLAIGCCRNPIGCFLLYDILCIAEQLRRGDVRLRGPRAASGSPQLPLRGQLVQGPVLQATFEASFVTHNKVLNGAMCMFINVRSLDAGLSALNQLRVRRHQDGPGRLIATAKVLL